MNRNAGIEIFDRDSNLQSSGCQKGSVIKGGVCNANERAQTRANADKRRFRLSEKGPKTQTNTNKRRIKELQHLLQTALLRQPQIEIEHFKPGLKLSSCRI